MAPVRRSPAACSSSIPDMQPTVYPGTFCLRSPWTGNRPTMAITPYLLYEDVGGALKFLAKAFGFKKYGAQIKGPDGKLNHAAMQLGDDLIMMGYPGPKYKNPKRLGQA